MGRKTARESYRLNGARLEKIALIFPAFMNCVIRALRAGGPGFVALSCPEHYQVYQPKTISVDACLAQGLK